MADNSDALSLHAQCSALNRRTSLGHFGEVRRR